MAASQAVAALLLLPWLHAHSGRIQSVLAQDEDFTMERRIVRLKRRAHAGSTLDVNGGLGLDGTRGRRARRARAGSTLDLHGALHLGCNEQWSTVKWIGEGSFGDIYEVDSDKGTGVLKKLKLGEGVKEGDEVWNDAVDEFEKEKNVMEIMKSAECPNTVQLIDADPCVDGGDSAPFQFVMPKYKTDLLKYMHSYRYIKNKDNTYGKCFKTIFREVVKGVDCMNNAGWVHMDIKPENVFITHPQDTTRIGRFDCKEVHVAVADYGLAYPDQEPQKPFVGKPYYHPPETFNIGRELGLEWRDAGHFVTDRKIDWCMLRILMERMDRVTGKKMLTEAFVNSFPDIIKQPFKECHFRG